MATVTLLDAVSSTGAGSTKTAGDVGFSWKMPNGIMSNFTVTAVASAATTAITIDLEGSLDDTTWFQLASHVFDAAEITAKAAMFHVINKPVVYIRGNMTAFTQAGSETVTVKCVGAE